MRHHSTHRLAVIVLMLLVATIARAQVIPNWLHVDGPDGTAGPEYVKSLAFHPSGALFAETSGGSLFRSNDDGASWERMTAVVETNSAGGIFIAPDGSLYVTSRHLYRSRDIGSTWQRLLSTKPNTGILASMELRNGTIIASQADGGIVASDDDGVTWRNMTLDLREYRPSILLQSASGAIYGIGRDHALRSTDDGRTWAMTTVGLLPYYRFETAVLGPGSLFHVCDATGMIGRSSDDGETWSIVSHPAPTHLRGVSPRGHMYAAPKSQRSLDTGRTWVSFFDGNLDAIAFRGDDEVVAAIGGLGLVRSLDGGATWRPILSDALTTRVAAIDAGGDGPVAALADGAIWLSSDRGTTWRVASAQPPGPIRAVAGGAVTLAGTDSGIYRTIDAGATWTRDSTGDTTEPSITVLSTNTDSTYAGTRDGRVLVESTDGWRTLSLRAPSEIRAIARTAAGHFIVAAADELHISFDGETWRSLRPDSTTTVIHALAVDATGVIFAGVDSGLVGSDDGGFTWRPMGTGLNRGPARSIVADLEGFVFVATDSGISTIVHRDRTWRSINGSLRSRHINVLAIAPGRTLLAGSDGDGIFQARFSGWSRIDADNTRATLRCEPNPATSRATIVIAGTTAGAHRILLRDPLGRLHATLFDGMLDGGEMRIPLETESLAVGAWLVEVIGPHSRRALPVVVMSR